MITVSSERELARLMGGLEHATTAHHKYHNKPTEIDGYTFDSQAEAARYGELQYLARLGEISGLRVHPRFVVVAKDEHGPAIRYEADFSYMDRNGREVVEDVKGGKATQTALWRLKFRLCQARWPGTSWEVVER